MYKILAKEALTPSTKLFRVEAPDVAHKVRAGQFVVIRIDERGERIPLTIADWDRAEGSITLISQEIGATTMRLGTLAQGDVLADFVGPLGLPSEIENYGTVICAGGGVGIAPVFPIARALKEAGNRVLSIVGARCRELLFWEERMREVSHELVVCTDDGSYARKALVTEPLKEILESGAPVARVLAIGPAVMMKFCSLTTKPFQVKTILAACAANAAGDTSSSFKREKRVARASRNRALRDSEYFVPSLNTWPTSIAWRRAIVLLHRSGFGRYVYAIGNSERAVFLSRANVQLVVVGSFALSASSATIRWPSRTPSPWSISPRWRSTTVSSLSSCAAWTSARRASVSLP